MQPVVQQCSDCLRLLKAAQVAAPLDYNPDNKVDIYGYTEIAEQSDPRANR